MTETFTTKSGVEIQVVDLNKVFADVRELLVKLAPIDRAAEELLGRVEMVPSSRWECPAEMEQEIERLRKLNALLSTHPQDLLVKNMALNNRIEELESICRDALAWFESYCGGTKRMGSELVMMRKLREVVGTKEMQDDDLARRG